MENSKVVEISLYFWVKEKVVNQTNSRPKSEFYVEDSNNNTI